MSYTFLTVCNSDKYLTGVLALNECLKAVDSRYPLKVLITKDTSLIVKDKLNDFGIQTIDIKKDIKLPDEVIEKNKKFGYSHWNGTLDKLRMFDLVQFDKIVYLDSDMFLLQNIDELFDKPHMSAVVAGKQYPGNESWKLLNSGCMVICPKLGLSDEILSVYNEVLNQREAFGDQDFLQIYYSDWEHNKELELDEKYNMFFDYLGYYTSHLGYNIKKNHKKNLSIIHFTGGIKPWMKSKREQLLQYIKYLLKGNFNQAYIYRRYISLIRSIERKENSI